MYAGRIRPGVVAALVDNLPAGCALGRDLGGVAAMSDEWWAIAQLDLDVRGLAWSLGGGKGEKPKAWEAPEGRRDREAREERDRIAKQRWQERAALRQQMEQDGDRMKLRDL